MTMNDLNIATQYDGTFDLEFLERHEKVYSAGSNSGAVIIRSKGKEIRVDKGDWIIRTPSGNLVKRSELP